ncbi:MOSC domain-containing protein [Nonomuraea polychroma]|uniref:MOSC domain-containing protein n=1 Tax=Nonomuraea polychroma TaxID=46176 RepID=UPI003D8DE511
MKARAPRLAAISLYPVKSTAAREVDRAHIGRYGLVGDREWMVVDGDGREATARELPALLHVMASSWATGGPEGVDLRLDAPGVPGLELTCPGGDDREVQLFGESLVASLAGAHADAWLRRAVGRDDVSLVWCAAPEDRRVAFGSGLTGYAAFQDESAVSLVSAASIAQVNEWIGDPQPLPASRFRANLLIDGVEPFAEDVWGAVRIGDAELPVAGPVARCVMTTIDPLTLSRGKEPIRTLARHRRWDGKTWIAVHLLVDRPGLIAVGDVVEVEPGSGAAPNAVMR